MLFYSNLSSVRFIHFIQNLKNIQSTERLTSGTLGLAFQMIETNMTEHLWNPLKTFYYWSKASLHVIFGTKI